MQCITKKIQKHHSETDNWHPCRTSHDARHRFPSGHENSCQGPIIREAEKFVAANNIIAECESVQVEGAQWYFSLLVKCRDMIGFDGKQQVVHWLVQGVASIAFFFLCVSRLNWNGFGSFRGIIADETEIADAFEFVSRMTCSIEKLYNCFFFVFRRRNRDSW